MVEVDAIVEGQTERDFMREVLAPYLANKDIMITARLPGRARKVGGVKKWEAVRDVVFCAIRARHSRVPCTIMFDYYGMTHDWPGRAEAKSQRSDARADHIETKLAEDFASFAGSDFRPDLFIPFVQMHEFEALLFSDTDQLVAAVFPAMGSQDKLRAELKAVVASFDHPEQINDDFENAPSKRLLKLIPGYRKTVDGVNAAKRIGIDLIREKCPHFNDWLTRLESLTGPTDAD